MIIRDIIQQLTLRTKAGRSPNWNIAQGNTLGGRSLAHWRAVSAKGASEVSFSQFPFALTARQYVGIYLPRVLPWVIFQLGFQPVFAACKPFLLNCEGRFFIVMPPLDYFEMMYLVVVNSTDESNNESNRKHER